MTAVPEKIGKYYVAGPAGRGSMGTVYRGHDPFTGQDVAIKVCTAAAGPKRGDRLTRKLFFNEAQTAGALKHPNIVRVLDAGDEEGLPYLVMEYIEGGQSLRDFCAVNRLLPVRRVAEIIHGCCWGLDYAHRNDVIHRDIKPSNILLSAAGEVKLGDFGIAQRTRSDTTQIMGLMGSPRYMSPEQVALGDLTGHTDLYSLGVVMFELLTGKTPFDADDLYALARQITHERPPAVRKLRADLPAGMEAVLLKALGKRPEQRFGTGCEMAAALSEVFAFLEPPDEELPLEEKFAQISALEFFSEFAPPEVWEVIHAGRWESYRRGDRIIVEGSIGMSFHVIVAGEVGVSKNDNAICTLAGGDCFGEMGYLSKERRSATIVGKNEVSLLTLDADIVQRTSLGCRVKFGEAFVRTLIRRLARTSEALLGHSDRLSGELAPCEDTQESTVVLPRGQLTS